MGKMTELTASDGFCLAAYLAEPGGAPRGALVVAQEIFGVNSHIRAVCDSFAAEGYRAIAPALFDRYEKGVDIGYAPEDIAQGRELKAKAAPAPRKLVGFKTLEKRDIARDHMPVVRDGKQIGFVTSAAPSPTCGINLGLAYVPTELAKTGGRIQIEIRGRAVDAEIIPTPFYKRTK